MGVHLSEILPKLGKVHVAIDNAFLRKLCRAAAQCESPAKSHQFVTKLGLRINKKAGRCTTVDGWLRGYRTVPSTHLPILVKLSGISWGLLTQNIVGIKAGPHGTFIKPTFPLALDERLGCIAGHIMGDGAIDAKYLQVSFSNKNPELLQEFADCMRAVFHCEPRIWQHGPSNFAHATWDRRLTSIDEKDNARCGGLFYPSICGKLLHALLGEFAVGSVKSITANIKQAPPAFKRAFVRAFFDDEGSCDAQSYHLRAHQKDKLILEDIRLFLEELNIESNPVCEYLKHGQYHHYFNITKKKNFAAFLKQVGFTSSNKQDKLIWLARPDQRCLVTPRRLQ